MLHIDSLNAQIWERDIRDLRGFCCLGLAFNWFKSHAVGPRPEQVRAWYDLVRFTQGCKKGTSAFPELLATPTVVSPRREGEYFWHQILEQTLTVPPEHHGLVLLSHHLHLL